MVRPEQGQDASGRAARLAQEREVLRNSLRPARAAEVRRRQELEEWRREERLQRLQKATEQRNEFERLYQQRERRHLKRLRRKIPLKMGEKKQQQKEAVAAEQQEGVRPQQEAKQQSSLRWKEYQQRHDEHLVRLQREVPLGGENTEGEAQLQQQQPGDSRGVVAGAAAQAAGPAAQVSCFASGGIVCGCHHVSAGGRCFPGCLCSSWELLAVL